MIRKASSGRKWHKRPLIRVNTHRKRLGDPLIDQAYWAFSWSVRRKSGGWDDILGLKAMTDFQLELKYFYITSTGQSYKVCASGISALNKCNRYLESNGLHSLLQSFSHTAYGDRIDGLCSATSTHSDISPMMLWVPLSRQYVTSSA